MHSFRSIVLIPFRHCRTQLLDVGRTAGQLPGLSELPGHQTSSMVPHYVQVFRRRLLPEEVLRLRAAWLVLLGLGVSAPILKSPEGPDPVACRENHEVCVTTSTSETNTTLRWESGIRRRVIDGELIVREVTERA